MIRKAPAFWYRPAKDYPPATERLLNPVSQLYKIGQALHKNLSTPKKPPVPVIAIGNLNTGGAGKTPTAIALAQLIKSTQLASKPMFLTRGYGGALKGPIRVDPETHNSHDTGDEALLLARHLPTIISRNRHEGALYAAEEGADLVIMDDALQNYQLLPAVRILVVDGMMGFGNMRTLPAGPLREPLAQGLKNIDIALLIGNDERGVKALLPKDLPLIEAHITYSGYDNLKNKTLLAFCGLGYPEKFFRHARESLGLNIVSTRAFPDHHHFTAHDMDALLAEAQDKGAALLTTEKDSVRIPAASKDRIGDVIHVLPMSLSLNDARFLKVLETHLGQAES